MMVKLLTKGVFKVNECPSVNMQTYFDSLAKRNPLEGKRLDPNWVEGRRQCLQRYLFGDSNRCHLASIQLYNLHQSTKVSSNAKQDNTNQM
jgi:hypothetical protein